VARCRRGSRKSYEPDQSVGAVARYILVVWNVALVEHSRGWRPSIPAHRFEVAIDYVGGNAARALGFPIPAIVAAKQR